MITVHNPWNFRLSSQRPTWHNPRNDNLDFATHVDREVDDRRRTWQAGFPAASEGGSDPEAMRRYEVPKPGAAVRLAGMRSRKQLNGKVAEVTGWDGEDGEGYVSVRIWEGAADRRGGASVGDWKKMRVHPRVLQPLRCMSDPSLTDGFAAPADDGASVFTKATNASGRSGASGSGGFRAADKAKLSASARSFGTLSKEPVTRTRRARATALPFKRIAGPGSEFSGHSCDNWW